MIGRSGRREAANSPSAGQSRESAARLRAMMPADLVDVLALEHDLFPDDSWTAEMFADEMAQSPETRLYLIAEADAGDGGVDRRDIVTGGGLPTGTAVAGYAGLMFVPGGRQADVLTIAVARGYWGRGIGSVLLDTMLRAARDRGCTEVLLEVRADNPRAHGLYQRRGFKDIGVRRGYYQPSGVDAIVMRKDLNR